MQMKIKENKISSLDYLNGKELDLDRKTRYTKGILWQMKKILKPPEKTKKNVWFI